MDDINEKFLISSFQSALNDITTNKDFIINIIINFIYTPADAAQPITLIDALRYKSEQKESFLEVNVAVFKAVKFFIFYKLEYDYKKLQTVERFFYRFLYVVDKLLQMYDTTKTDDAYYIKCFKKLFTESNNFARQMSNPISAKGDKKLQSFFDKLKKAFIDPPRIKREQHKEALQVLDKKVAEKQIMLSVAEQQQIRLEKGIRNLLQSSDLITAKYIVDTIIFGSTIKFKKDTPAPPATTSRVGGKAKRRRRIIGGVEPNPNPKDSIIKYFDIENTFDFDINKIANGRYTCTIKTFIKNQKKFDKPILPELKEVVPLFYNPTTLRIFISTFFNICKNLNIENDDWVISLTAKANPHLQVAGLFFSMNTTPSDEDKSFILKLLKAKYEKHPMVIINNKINAFV